MIEGESRGGNRTGDDVLVAEFCWKEGKVVNEVDTLFPRVRNPTEKTNWYRL